MTNSADIAIIGLGSAALQFAKLAYQLPNFRNKQIVFIDPIKGCSKSWCFWHKGTHIMDCFVSHEWTQLQFGHKDFERTQEAEPYTYRHVSSDDMYNWFFEELLPTMPSWRFEQVKISEIRYQSEGIILNGSDFSLTSALVLDSRLQESDFQKPLIWQHFRGLIVKTDKNVFDVNTATFMDFSLTSNYENPAFVYVLPFSSSEALIETTVFSSQIWPNERYDSITRDYITNRWPSIRYEIEGTESGRIPMGFLANKTTLDSRHIKIGGANGSIKPSTGYAFQRIHKSILLLIEDLYIKEKALQSNQKRFEFYDKLLLHIIKNKPHKVENIMAQLFKKNSISSILEFLDEESSIAKEAKIFSTLPFEPFLRALSKISK